MFDYHFNKLVSVSFFLKKEIQKKRFYTIVVLDFLVQLFNFLFFVCEGNFVVVFKSGYR